MYDYVLVGGGLQNALISLALLAKRPDVRIVMLERGPRVGGNHTWCFHSDDVDDPMAAVIEPLVGHRWPRYRVAFPGAARELALPYAAVTSERLDQVVTARVREAPGCELRTSCEAIVIGAREVVLADGSHVEGRVVVDARGPAELDGRAGYQKFVGHELVLHEPHGLDGPVLMDATVPQVDGFRFMYVLPLAPDRVLVEDTYFSDEPALDREAVGAAIGAYVAGRGWRVAERVRDEAGVLPMPWAGTCEVGEGGPLVGGYAGGWFHPATGYSFPVAARLAAMVAELEPSALFSEPLQRLARAQQQQLDYCHRLNRMLFGWFAPEERWNVFARFYRLPEATIRRFYALQLSRIDRGRILLGWPPRGISWRAVFARSQAS